MIFCEYPRHDEDAVRDAEHVVVLRVDPGDCLVSYWCDDCRERVIYGTDDRAVALDVMEHRPLRNHAEDL